MLTSLADYDRLALGPPLDLRGRRRIALPALAVPSANECGESRSMRSHTPRSPAPSDGELAAMSVSRTAEDPLHMGGQQRLSSKRRVQGPRLSLELPSASPSRSPAPSCSPPPSAREPPRRATLQVLIASQGLSDLVGSEAPRAVGSEVPRLAAPMTARSHSLSSPPSQFENQNKHPSKPWKLLRASLPGRDDPLARLRPEGVAAFAAELIESFGSLANAYKDLDTNSQQQFTRSQWSSMLKRADVDVEALCGVPENQLFRLLDTMDGKPDFIVVRENWFKFFRDYLEGTAQEFLLTEDRIDLTSSQPSKDRRQPSKDRRQSKDRIPSTDGTMEEHCVASSELFEAPEDFSQDGPSKSRGPQILLNGTRHGHKSPGALDDRHGTLADDHNVKLQQVQQSGSFPAASGVVMRLSDSDDRCDDVFADSQNLKLRQAQQHGRSAASCGTIMDERRPLADSQNLDLRQLQQLGRFAEASGQNLELQQLQQSGEFPASHANDEQELVSLRWRGVLHPNGGYSEMQSPSRARGRSSSPADIDFHPSSAATISSDSDGDDILIGRSVARSGSQTQTRKRGNLESNLDSGSESAEGLTESGYLSTRLFKIFATGRWRGQGIMVRQPDVSRFAENSLDFAPRAYQDIDKLRAMFESIFDDTLELQIHMAEPGHRTSAGLTLPWFETFVQKIINRLGVSIIPFLMDLLALLEGECS